MSDLSRDAVAFRLSLARGAHLAGGSRFLSWGGSRRGLGSCCFKGLGHSVKGVLLISPNACTGFQDFRLSVMACCTILFPHDNSPNSSGACGDDVVDDD